MRDRIALAGSVETESHVASGGIVRIRMGSGKGATSMAVTATAYKHIQLDEQGTAIIAGSTMKVVELITSHQVHGWNPEKLQTEYPHLSLGQIYSALAYYWDHKELLDTEMQRREAYVRQIEQQTPASPFANRIRAEGLLP